MKLKEVEVLIDKINSSEISLFEVKIDNFYIKMDKSLDRNSSKEEQTSNMDKSYVENISTTKQENISKDNFISIPDVAEVLDENLYTVTSPMVGTFYTAPGVGLDNFVEAGKTVKEGDTLCIIEAMKLMNEIESDVSGEIIKVLINNGEMVEYGTELFKIRR